MRPGSLTRSALAVAVLLFVFTALYRFNALGGALGGFDDDHFVHLVYAMQVQAGEQPLRDFVGLGLQGARPSLTYEVSALAQTVFGRNLRSEALLTVGALALASAITWLAARRVAPAGFALAATLLSVFIAPKLYSYPKVLIFAAAAWLIGWYAAVPGMRRVGVLAALTAAAFLFRHDYAVYVGVGVFAVLVLARRDWVTAARHAGGYAALTLLLLTPSLLIVQRDAGLLTYIGDSIDAARHESRRTNLQWPAFSPGLVSEDNAIAWLYYLHLLVPVLLLVVLAVRRHAHRTEVAALAVMALVMNALLLRGNVGARFGDVAPVMAVLLAFAAAWAFQSRRGHAIRVVWSGIAAAAAVATIGSVWIVGSVHRELDTTGWSDSIGKITEQSTRVWRELATLPGGLQHGVAERPDLRTAQYLRQCTAERDRIVVFSYQPELLGFADRRFGAGRASFVPELLASDRHQQDALRWWRRERVPLVLSEAGEGDEGYASEFPLLAAHLRSDYIAAGELPLQEGVTLHLFHHRALSPVRTHPITGLPCFR